eukprot:10223955-Karenia_brevis.AAC.1
MSDSEERFQHSVQDAEDQARCKEMEQDAAIQAMDEDELQQDLDKLRAQHDEGLFVFGGNNQGSQLPAVNTPPPGLHLPKQSEDDIFTQDPWRQKDG